MTAVCPVCYARQDESLLCDSCTSGLTTDLRGNAAIMGVAELVDNLHVAQAKQAKIGAQGKGGLASERWSLNPDAMEAARHLEHILGSWAMDLTSDAWWPARHLLHPVRQPGSPPGPYCPQCAHPSCRLRRGYEYEPAAPAAVQAAEVLLDHVDDIRRHGAVRDLVEEVRGAIERGRQTADRPDGFSRFPVGPCPEDDDDGQPCTRTVFALCPAEDSARPALMACYQMVPDERRPDLGAGFTHTWDTTQWLRAGRRILARREQDKRRRGAA